MTIYNVVDYEKREGWSPDIGVRSYMKAEDAVKSLNDELEEQLAERDLTREEAEEKGLLSWHLVGVCVHFDMTDGNDVGWKSWMQECEVEEKK